MNKGAARQEYKLLRKSLTALQIEEFSQAIFEKVLDIIEKNKPKTIHLFLPITAMQEPNTYLLIDLLRDKKITIGVPKVDATNNSMMCVQYIAENKLEHSTWNIPEPTGADLKIISPKEIDLMILPMLICDSEGNRVGYGKGFYDQYIKQCKPDMLKVGICYFDPIAKITDVFAHDQQLNCCVTPTKIYNFRN